MLGFKKSTIVEIFRTTVKNEVESEQVIAVLQKVFANARINFDLEDCDNILRIEADIIDTNLVSSILLHHGYNSEVLN